MAPRVQYIDEPDGQMLFFGAWHCSGCGRIGFQGGDRRSFCAYSIEFGQKRDQIFPALPEIRTEVAFPPIGCQLAVLTTYWWKRNSLLPRVCFAEVCCDTALDGIDCERSG